jgi:nucleoside phosphorylase
MTSPAAHGRLLIACALSVERFALRGGADRGRTRDRTEAAGGSAAAPARPYAAQRALSGREMTVLRTGMGPQAAERALVRALRDEPVPGGTAVLAAGFCAGLVDGLRPGDLVVAEETRDETGATECTGAALLAEALAPYGTVHTGTLAGSARVVRGAGRTALHEATGAVAADMESAAVLRTAAGRPELSEDAEPVVRRPVAAVRVVVDAPGHELIRVGTLRGGISACRVLRGILPAFLDWHRTLLLPWR